MAHLTNRRLEAIIEALESRLAGEIDIDGISGLTHADYEAASEWASDKLRERLDRKAKRDQR